MNCSYLVGDYWNILPDITYQTGSKGLVGVFVEYLDDVFDDTGRYHPHSFQSRGWSGHCLYSQRPWNKVEPILNYTVTTPLWSHLYHRILFCPYIFNWYPHLIPHQKHLGSQVIGTLMGGNDDQPWTGRVHRRLYPFMLGAQVAASCWMAPTGAHYTAQNTDSPGCDLILTCIILY